MMKRNHQVYILEIFNKAEFFVYLFSEIIMAYKANPKVQKGKK